MIRQYDKIKTKDGKIAVIVEVLEPQKAFIADIEVAEDDFTTETIFYSDIMSVFVEVETPLERVV
ncbi:MAG: hypothetical protein FWH20_01770 [Oscillospiraceae bacterium]|nr:hypothetical protein [Oscillospiraceae bacterium]